MKLRRSFKKMGEAFSIDPMKIKIEKERDPHRELTTSEELELYENEIKQLRINPQKLREEEA